MLRTAVLALSISVFSSALAADTIKGPVREGSIPDGDTFSIAFRIWGIDTPESRQMCRKEQLLLSVW